MEYVKVAEGTSLLSFSQLLDYERYFNEGEYGELRLTFFAPLPESTVAQLNQSAQQRGLRMWDDIQQSGSTLYIRAVQGVAWIPIIVAVLAIIAVILIVRWVLLKVVREKTQKAEANLMFAAANILPIAMSAFGPQGGKKAKATLLGSLLISGYFYHYLGSRDALPEAVQDLYNQIMGRQPPTDGELPPPSDGVTPPTPPTPEPVPPAPTTRISNVFFWGQAGTLAGTRQITVQNGFRLRPVVQFHYEGSIRDSDNLLWIRVGIAPSRVPFGHYYPRAWVESRVAIPAPPGDYIIAVGGVYGVTWPPPADPGQEIPKGDLDAVVVILNDDATLSMPVEGVASWDTKRFFGKWYDPVYKYV